MTPPPVKNIYYMLSYAFKVLKEREYKKVSTESFENMADLCAAILIRGVTVQIKRGLNRDYGQHTDSLSGLRGKIEMVMSIKNNSLAKRRLVCSYDEFTVNSPMNRIIKSTAELLLRSPISPMRKKEIRKLMQYFTEVETIDLKTADWHIRFNRNQQTYRMLLSICYMVVKGLLQTQSDGTVYLLDFVDEQQMCQLYEKFILEYYKREHPYLNVSAAQIPWALDDDVREMLPAMKSDITLTSKEDESKILIIDAKYYSRTTRSHFDTQTLHSHNLYQIFTYVKNKDYPFRAREHHVSGMLLYARTDEARQPDQVYNMSGNKIYVKTLDLNSDFAAISKRLNEIAWTYFGID